MGWFSDFLTRNGIVNIQTDAIPLTAPILKTETDKFPLGVANFQAGGQHSYETTTELINVPLGLLIAPMTALVGAAAPYTRYILETIPTTGDYLPGGTELQDPWSFWKIDGSLNTTGATGVTEVVADITARDALVTVVDGYTVYVTDAQDDPELTSGWAIYKSIGAQSPGTGVWARLESEQASSIDVTDFILVDGTRAFTGNQSMGSNKLRSLSSGTAAADAIRKDQALLLDGTQSMSASLAMGGFKVTGLAAGTAATDAVNKSQLDALDSATFLQLLEDDYADLAYIRKNFISSKSPEPVITSPIGNFFSTGSITVAMMDELNNMRLRILELEQTLQNLNLLQ